jgi:glucose uptake protein GlcU
MLNLIYPLISIIAENSAKTVDKFNFKRTRIASRQLMWLVFVGMTLSLGGFIILSGQEAPPLSLISIGLVLLIAAVSFGSNILDYLSLKVDDLSLREPMSDFQIILAGLVGYIVFPDERKPGFLLAFALGAIIMYWGTHRRKLRKFQKKGMLFFLFSIILESFLPSIYKITLEYLDPTFIAFFRVVLILMLASLFFPLRKTLKKISPKRGLYGLGSGVIYAVGTVASLYSIHTLGVVQTMLIFLLGPTLRYITCYFVLNEKVRKGEMISSAILVGIIILAVAR